jgi:N-acetylmuramic acid 6-phosphate etherase
LSHQFTRITEQPSEHAQLDSYSIRQLLEAINQADQTVPLAVAQAIPQIEALVAVVVERMQQGGRLFYLGAGTSGRLGIVDASECPPTYGVPFDKVIGLIAGGDAAIRKAVEFAEDDTEQGWKDLQAWQVGPQDVVVGIAASGTTPYVLGALQTCKAQGIATGCIVCNPGAPIALAAAFPVEVAVGPEVVTGSTRMKSGTAQKLVLNMLSTSVMVKLGYVKGSKMVQMQLSNHKLVDRGTRMLMEELQLPYETAAALLAEHKQVKAAADAYRKQYPDA